MVKNRNKGIDLLRTILILMIIMHHTLLRGSVSLRLLETGDFDTKYNIFIFINSFLVVAVNCYFLISGYFKIKLHWIKIIKLLGSVYFIYFTVNIAYIVCTQAVFTISMLKGFLFPISQFWFVFIYFVLSMLSPYLNIFLKELNVDDEKRLLSIMVLVWCIYAFLIDNEIFGANRGYSLIMAIILYIIGDYISKLQSETSAKKQVVKYLVCSGANGVLAIICALSGHQSWTWKLFSYNNPIILYASICLFAAFINLPCIMSEKIANLGRYTLYIYILHSTPVFANFYMDIYEKNVVGKVVQCAGYSILLTIVLYVLGLFVGILYEKIWDICANR